MKQDKAGRSAVLHLFERHAGGAGLGEAVAEAMRAEMARAGAHPVATERRRALMETLLSLRDQVIEAATAAAHPESTGDPLARRLAGERAQAIAEATRHWATFLKRLRYRERERMHRRDYRHEACGAPPYRDPEHGALRILEATARSLPDVDGATWPFDAVAPFLAAHRAQRDRARAYERMLHARRIQPADLLGPEEAPLLGQRGVFASVAIREGTCVGVYGGVLLDEVDVFCLRDDRYLMGLRSSRGNSFVNGENLLSLTNTIYAYGPDGRIAGHPAQGYNLLRVTYPVTFAHGWRVGVPAFFAVRDIVAGSELRWNYEACAAG